MYAVAMSTRKGELISFQEFPSKSDAQNVFAIAKASQKDHRIDTVALFLHDGAIEDKKCSSSCEGREYTPPMKRRATQKDPTPDQQEKFLRVVADLLAIN